MTFRVAICGDSAMWGQGALAAVSSRIIKRSGARVCGWIDERPTAHVCQPRSWERSIAWSMPMWSPSKSAISSPRRRRRGMPCAPAIRRARSALFSARASAPDPAAVGRCPRSSRSSRYVMVLKVAVIGDSAMWGQGLKLEHQYAHLAAGRIAADLNEDLEIMPGSGEEPGRGYPRSGAKIRARVQRDDPVQVLMPGGSFAESAPGDRANFARTFRSLFETDEEMTSFLDGSDERPAARLFGEHPAAFPTTTGSAPSGRGGWRNGGGTSGDPGWGHQRCGLSRGPRPGGT